MVCPKLLLIFLLAIFIRQAWSVDMKLYDKHYYIHHTKRIFALIYQLYMNTETSMRHIQKYIDMHVGTIDFELGLIAGAVLKTFRTQLHNYRHMSALWRFTYDSSLYNFYDHQAQTFYRDQLICVSNMQEIFEYKNVFDQAVARYMEEQKIITQMRRDCRKKGRCPSSDKMAELARALRRSSDIDISQQVDQDTGELEIDYFGHQVPKTKKNQGPDKVDQLFNTVERSFVEDLPEQEIKPTMKSGDNFTRINDWLRYLANGGLEENKKKAEEEEEELRKEVEDKFTETPSTLKPLTSKWPNTHSVNKMKDVVHFDEDDDKNYNIQFGAKNLKNPLSPLSPWSRPGSDTEVKKKMKQQFYDKMRGNFDPKREGIDIDLNDMF